MTTEEKKGSLRLPWKRKDPGGQVVRGGSQNEGSESRPTVYLDQKWSETRSLVDLLVNTLLRGGSMWCISSSSYYIESPNISFNWDKLSLDTFSQIYRKGVNYRQVTFSYRNG